MPDPQDQPQHNPPRRNAPKDNNTSSGLTFYLVLLFGIGLLAAIIFKAPVIDGLSDPAFARGLITWIISIATIGLAFILMYQAFFSVESSDDRFRRAREVFTGLMGVLGTIVGFYFGSAEKPTAKLDIADIKLMDKQLITHVSGGVAPYRYTITSTEKDFTPIKNQVSDDGWIAQVLDTTPQGGKLTVDVTDSKDLKASKDLKLQPAALTPKASTSPSALPSSSTSDR